MAMAACSPCLFRAEALNTTSPRGLPQDAASSANVAITSRRQSRRKCATVRAEAESNGSVTTTSTFDVSNSCVSPVFRSFPDRSSRGGDGSGNDDSANSIAVLFVSEGNVCRSVLAESIFKKLVADRGLAGNISCYSKAIRDYNVGEAPDSRAVQVASQYGVSVPEGKVGELMKPAEDVVMYDLLLVMDKFNAADVLKEVSVFDTIDPTARYSSRVRRLGAFSKARPIEDIDDPLYGNMGGPEELESLSAVISDLQDACAGLLDDLIAVQERASKGGVTFQAEVSLWLQGMEDMDWLVPPMLQKRK